MGQNNSDLEFPHIDRSSYQLKIVYSLFNAEFSSQLMKDACTELRLNGISNAQIKTFAVPGALEIPFLVNAISDRYDCDGILALGCIIRGETYHFEIVANESARGLLEISCKKNIPCVNGILTVEDQKQASERSLTKGKSFAQTLIYMVDLSKTLKKNKSS